MVALRLKYRRCKEEVDYGYFSTQAVQKSHFTGQIIGSTLLLPRCFRTWLQLCVAKPVTPHSSILSSFAADRFGIKAEEDAAGDDDAACLALAL